MKPQIVDEALSRKARTAFAQALESGASEIEAARELARVAHGDQMYGKAPYVEGHLDKVHALTEEFGLSMAEKLAAYVHDTLEDTALSPDVISELLGPEVLQLVQAVSGFGQNRKACRQDIVSKLTLYPAAIGLKVCDRLVNVRASAEQGRTDLLKLYRSEWPDYAPLFSRGPAQAVQELKRLLGVD